MLVIEGQWTEQQFSDYLVDVNRKTLVTPEARDRRPRAAADAAE